MLILQWSAAVCKAPPQRVESYVASEVFGRLVCEAAAAGLRHSRAPGSARMRPQEFSFFSFKCVLDRNLNAKQTSNRETGWVAKQAIR